MDPADSVHGKSLSDAIYDLIVNVGVDKIIMHDHFIQLSETFGGEPGAPGEDSIRRADGTEERIPAKGHLTLSPGDILIVKTPGGGGHGALS